MKKCHKCNTVKNLSDFHKQSSSKDGRQSNCIDCKKKYFKSIKDRLCRYQSNYRSKRDNGLYSRFINARKRCNDKSYKGYHNYGGRGILVEWSDYVSFKEDMYESFLEHLKDHGREETTLDRIDPNKNYCKGNCRWATRKQQATENKRSMCG